MPVPVNVVAFAGTLVPVAVHAMRRKWPVGNSLPLCAAFWKATAAALVHRSGRGLPFASVSNGTFGGRPPYVVPPTESTRAFPIVLRRIVYSPRASEAPCPGCVSKPNADIGAAL